MPLVAAQAATMRNRQYKNLPLPVRSSPRTGNVVKNSMHSLPFRKLMQVYKYENQVIIGS